MQLRRKASEFCTGTFLIGLSLLQREGEMGKGEHTVRILSLVLPGGVGEWVNATRIEGLDRVKGGGRATLSLARLG
jgi:hypothetical protein